jgi:ComF family protein
MPLTNFWQQKDNPVEQLFWGKIKIEHAASLFYFEKDSRYQNILHQLKYKGKQNIGIQLGRIFGYHLCNSNFKTIDAIIPVPLHKKRLRKRGYNQSDMIGIGLSKSMNKPLLNNCVSRVIHTSSQTKKNRYSRWLNVEGIFKIDDPIKLEGKHILVVDDVVTTGSTIESLVMELLKIKKVKISIVTLAVA